MLEQRAREELGRRLVGASEQREKLLLFVAKVLAGVAREELEEGGGRVAPFSGAMFRRPAKPPCLHEPVMVVVRERDQGGSRFMPRA